MSAPRRPLAAAAGQAFLALTLGAAAPGAAQPGVLGEVVAVENRAEYSLPRRPLEELVKKQPLILDMRIVTYADSDAVMAYDHPRAMLFLGPETEFEMRTPSVALADYRCPNPELVDRLADLAQDSGEVRIVREPPPAGCPLRVLTQVAVVVIVGTDLSVRVDPADGTTVVSVAEGAVEVYRRDPETGEPTGEPVRLEAGEVSVVAPGRRPSLPAPEDPGPSLQSPQTRPAPLGDPLGAPIPPGTIDVRGFCFAAANLALPICRRVPPPPPPPADPPVGGQVD